MIAIQLIYNVNMPLMKKATVNPKSRKWFKASLKQVRHYGPINFPPIKWVVIIIRNAAEHDECQHIREVI